MEGYTGGNTGGIGHARIKCRDNWSLRSSAHVLGDRGQVIHLQDHRRSPQTVPSPSSHIGRGLRVILWGEGDGIAP